MQHGYRQNNTRLEPDLLHLCPEFYQRRIFWYDEDKEFEDKLDEVVLENAEVII